MRNDSRTRGWSSRLKRALSRHAILPKSGTPRMPGDMESGKVLMHVFYFLELFRIRNGQQRGIL